MAQLVLTEIEPAIVQKLKERADKNGVSVEEEHRRILRKALNATNPPRPSFKEHLLSMPDIGFDFERQKDIPRDIDL